MHGRLRFCFITLTLCMDPFLSMLTATHMTLRSHLDRYCGLSAMMNPDQPVRRRSRSPPPVALPPGFRLSPFFAPPGWQPPLPRPDRAVIIQIDLSQMKHLAMLDNYYDILASGVHPPL